MTLRLCAVGQTVIQLCNYVQAKPSFGLLLSSETLIDVTQHQLYVSGHLHSISQESLKDAV